MQIVNIKSKLFQLVFCLLTLNFFGCRKRGVISQPNFKEKTKPLPSLKHSKKRLKSSGKIAYVLPDLSMMKGKALSEKYKVYLLHLAKNPKNIPLQFKLAKCCEKMKKYEEAASRYKYCYTMSSTGANSPKEGTSIADLSRYSEIVCVKKNAFEKNIHCDTNPLETTVRLAENYLKNGHSYNSENIRSILNECKLKLLEKKEMLVNFYLSKNNTLAAQTVLEQIKSNFSEVETILPRCGYLECCILIKKGEVDKAKGILNHMKQHYSESPLTARAEGRLNFFLGKPNFDVVLNA